jgi:hypothetical protein
MAGQYDVFVSYSGADGEWVHTVLVPYLTGCGLSVITQKKFEPGLPITDNMNGAIVQSRFTIPVLSPEYMESNFTKSELRIARDKDVREGTFTILPIVLRPCPDLPSGVKEVTYVTLYDALIVEDELKRVVDRIGPPLALTVSRAKEAVEALKPVSGEATSVAMRLALGVSERVFKKISEQIVLLADLKKFHDLLHQLQTWYDLVALNLSGGAASDELFDDLFIHGDALEAIVCEMREAEAETKIGTGVLAWIDDIEHAHAMLVAAVAARDMKPLRTVNRTIDVVLGIQPSVINSLMNETVANLLLQDLRDAVKAVHEAAKNADVPEESVDRVGKSLTTIEELVNNVAVRVRVHGVWQIADNELRLAEKSLKGGLDDLLDDWTRVKEKIARVLDDGEEWTEDITAGRDRVDAAIASGNAQMIKSAVRRLRNDGKRWFIKLDTRLRHECDELRVVGTHLQLLEIQ